MKKSEDNLDPCTKCGVKYPAEYLAPLRSNDGTTHPVCGICALELSNKVLGIERTSFDGEIAEDMRQRALRWRAQRSAPETSS